MYLHKIYYYCIKFYRFSISQDKNLTNLYKKIFNIVLLYYCIWKEIYI